MSCRGRMDEYVNSGKIFSVDHSNEPHISRMSKIRSTNLEISMEMLQTMQIGCNRSSYKSSLVAAVF